MFKQSVEERRCVIPAAGFYEWDKSKTKIAFMHRNDPVLYLAGFWRDDRFIILTTVPNNSIADVHNRMPLILSSSEIESWILEPEAYKLLLRKIPEPLDRVTADKLV